MKALKTLVAIALSTAGLGTAVTLGVVANNDSNNVRQAEAADTTFNSGSKIYLDVSKCNWFADSAKVALWNHQANAFNEFKKDSNSNYYVTTLTANTSSFNVFRGSALNWNNKWNQSDDGSFTSGCNLMVAGSYSGDKLTFTWGKYDGNTSKTTGSLYLRVPNNSHNLKVYTYESINVGGIDVEMHLQGDWPGTAVTTKTTKTIYNPANLSVSSKGIYKIDFEYYSLSNVGVIINANNAGYQTKDLKASPTSSQFQLSLGAYYYGEFDNNLWDNFHYNDDMGYDASVAYEIDQTDVCNISKSSADALRSKMDSNKGYLVNTTWDGYTYEQAYNWIDSKCTTPTLSSNNILNMSNSNSSIIVGATIASMVAISGFGAFFLLRRKRKEQ